MGSKNIIKLFLIILTYFIFTGMSYVLFSKGAVGSQLLNPTPPLKQTASGHLMFDESLPRTESCPLNGALHSKQQKAWWEKHRPLGVMIENHEDARPQSGLSFADVVYEAVAEGAITRFLAVYYCQDADVIGPVRSARTYFIDFLSEYGDYPLYAHVGGANTEGPANALGQIGDYGWTLYNDLNQFSLGCPIYCQNRTRTGREVATEHTQYSSTTKLWKVAESRGLTNVDKKGSEWDEKFTPYTFKDDAKGADLPATQSINIQLWEGYRQYFVDWNFDKTTNEYKRSNGGKPHIDKNTNKQLTVKNIVALFMQESHANDGYENNVHLLYKTKGTGKAIVFMDGKKIEARWKKDGRTSRTLLFDNNGTAIQFNRGLIWFEILPTDGIVDVK